MSQDKIRNEKERKKERKKEKKKEANHDISLILYFKQTVKCYYEELEEVAMQYLL